MLLLLLVSSVTASKQKLQLHKVVVVSFFKPTQQHHPFCWYSLQHLPQHLFSVTTTTATTTATATTTSITNCNKICDSSILRHYIKYCTSIGTCKQWLNSNRTITTESLHNRTSKIERATDTDTDTVSIPVVVDLQSTTTTKVADIGTSSIGNIVSIMSSSDEINAKQQATKRGLDNENYNVDDISSTSNKKTCLTTTNSTINSATIVDSTNTATIDDNNNNSNIQTIIEGSCEMILVNKNDTTNVFYNPVQVKNRDLSIIMISMYCERRAVRIIEQQYKKIISKTIRSTSTTTTGSTNEIVTKQQRKDNELQIQQQINEKVQEYMKSISGRLAIEMLKEQEEETTNTTTTNNTTTIKSGISILDALAASGLRSIRYWKEIPNHYIHHITINDIETSAIIRAYNNVVHNIPNTNSTSGSAIESTTGTATNGTSTTTTTTEHPSVLVRNRTDHGIRINQNDAIDEMYNSRPIHSLLLQQPPIPIPFFQNNKNNTNDQSQQEQQQSHVKHVHIPYDVIDLDPYGSACQFLDAAIQAVTSDGDGRGMLCVTCTDMIVLSGNHCDTAFTRYYGSMPIPNGKYLQEVAVRIVLYAIAMTAAKYNKIIHPILSVGMDFYIRVFVEIHTCDKSILSKLSTNHIGYIYQSTQCPSYHIVPAGKIGGTNGNTIQPGRMPLSSSSSSSDNNNDDNSSNNNTIGGNKHISQCEETGATFKIGGPIWIGPMHDPIVLKDLLHRLDLVKKYNNTNNNNTSKKTKHSSTQQQQEQDLLVPTKEEQELIDVFQHISTTDRIHGLIVSCYEECAVSDKPLYYNIHDLAQTINVTPPSIKNIQNALINLGYTVSGYHKEPHALKTNAPNNVIWDIFRTWAIQHPPIISSKKLNKRIQKLNNKQQLQKLNRDKNTKQMTSTTTNDDTSSHVTNDTMTDENNNIDTDPTTTVESTSTSTSTEQQEQKKEIKSDNNPWFQSVGEKILSQPITTKGIDFTYHRRTKSYTTFGTRPISRFPVNPEANWGPKPAAKGQRIQQQQSDVIDTTSTIGATKEIQQPQE